MRQSIIKVWLVERLKAEAANKPLNGDAAGGAHQRIVSGTFMAKLFIQFQPQRDHILDEIKISDYLRNLGLDIEITEGFDTGGYTNFVIETDRTKRVRH